jgi:7-carboxy-7-deazaguanine synthase
VDKLIQMAIETGVGLVEVTGGEPLLQEETLRLVEALCDSGLEVLVETNGSMDISVLDPRAIIIMDIKTPGSAMAERMDMENIHRLKDIDEVKFVITSKEDYLWARDFVRQKGLEGPRTLFSPTWGSVSAEALSEWILRDRLNVRLNLQIHKYIFGDRRGV